MGLSSITAGAAGQASPRGDRISGDVPSLFTMKSGLTDGILSLQPGDHLCLFYDRDPSEQMSEIVPFAQQALQRDEQFVYVADDQTVEELIAHLERGGIGVKQETERGRLKLWTRREEGAQVCAFADH